LVALVLGNNNQVSHPMPHNLYWVAIVVVVAAAGADL
jgi:hypothetical protein